MWAPSGRDEDSAVLRPEDSEAAHFSVIVACVSLHVLLLLLALEAENLMGRPLLVHVFLLLTRFSYTVNTGA